MSTLLFSIQFLPHWLLGGLGFQTHSHEFLVQVWCDWSSVHCASQPGMC